MLSENLRAARGAPDRFVLRFPFLEPALFALLGRAMQKLVCEIRPHRSDNLPHESLFWLLLSISAVPVRENMHHLNVMTHESVKEGDCQFAVLGCFLVTRRAAREEVPLLACQDLQKVPERGALYRGKVDQVYFTLASAFQVTYAYLLGLNAGESSL